MPKTQTLKQGEHKLATEFVLPRSQLFKSAIYFFAVPTAGEELRPDGGDELALQGLREGALCVLDGNVPLFDPPQQPQQVAVTQ